MKILQLTAENIKKLSVVEIKPNGHMVEITGRNDSGNPQAPVHVSQKLTARTGHHGLAPFSLVSFS